MDARLLSWAARVKPCRGRLPRLWLFTDVGRQPDPLAVIAGLPRGLAGVVIRPEGMARPQVAAVAALCRARRLPLAVAGDWRLAWRLRAGLHLRGGRRPARCPASLRSLTASAHDAVEVHRSSRANLVFISPVFATRSHPGADALGIRRWARLARIAGARAAALGGMNGDSVRHLPPSCRAVGAIDALGGVAARPQCFANAM